MAACRGSVVIGLDFQAAFQSVLRSTVRYAPWLHEARIAWYVGHAVHNVHDDKGKLTEVHATRGVDQVCPLGALLFALACATQQNMHLTSAQQHDPKATLFLTLTMPTWVSVRSLWCRLWTAWGRLLET